MGGMPASRFYLMYEDIISNLILINPIGLENYLEYGEYRDVGFFYKKNYSLSLKILLITKNKIITMVIGMKIMNY